MGEKWKNLPFLGRTHTLVLVPKVGTGTPSPVKDWYRYHQSGTTTRASSNPVFVPLALLSLVFVHRLFRDPNKGLMGVHIRAYKRENVPYLTAEAKLRTINYSTTKSKEFVFD